jgi:outer membrane receptor protein involved in Fe transport
MSKLAKPSRARLPLLVGVSLIGIALAPAALAQSAAEAVPASDQAGVIVYPASFFASSHPNNAFEMIQRLPGFTLDGGDGGVRGYSGSGGNLLIDGARPASKSVPLRQQLSRIPATAIERIELIRGGAPGIDMQGQTLIANVVRSADALTTIAVVTRNTYHFDGKLAPRIAVEGARSFGALTVEGVLSYDERMADDGGKGRATLRAPGGTVLRSDPLFASQRTTTYSGNGSAQMVRPNDTWRANISIDNEIDESVELIGARRIDIHRDDLRGEAGLEYERNLSEQLSLKLLGLHARSGKTITEFSTNAGDVETVDQKEEPSESILRGSLMFRPDDALTLETGVEGAINVLNFSTDVVRNGTAIILPNANVRVEENRAEPFATARLTVSPGLTVESGVRIETSKITQSGDTDLSRTFTFAKPRVAATWSPRENSQVRLRLEREVGQLDFQDFTASAELGLGTVSAGNADLEPERAWVLEAALEQRFWGEGAVILTYIRSEIEQVLDQIPVDGRFDAPGNIGDGSRDEFKISGALPMDRLMIPGGRVSGEITFTRSQATDPVTGQTRRIARDKPVSGLLTFTQDIASLRSTWGLELEALPERSRSYRIDEIRESSVEAYLTAYWEWKPDPTMAIRFQLENLTGRETRQLRTLYDGPRSTGRVDAIDDRYLDFDPMLTVRLRKVL